MTSKTLKDIPIRRPKGIELPYLDWYKLKLKEEAIKDIKELRESYEMELDCVNIKIRGNKNSIFAKAHHISELCFDDEKIEFETKSEAYKKAIKLLINWIKWKFNLTEEDLK